MRYGSNAQTLTCTIWHEVTAGWFDLYATTTTGGSSPISTFSAYLLIKDQDTYVCHLAEYFHPNLQITAVRRTLLCIRSLIEVAHVLPPTFSGR